MSISSLCGKINKSIKILFFQISDVEVPFDKTQNKRKGFCFIVFEGEKTAFEIIKQGKQTINGIEVS